MVFDTRNEQDGSFTWDLMAKFMRLVIVEEEGKVYRDKAKEIKISTWIVSLTT